MTHEQITEKIEEWRITFLGDDWKWRKGQAEAIMQILLTYFNKTHNVVILDCPTGGGKSAIALAVAWILNQENKSGFILASDIALQEQYEKDFKKANIKWGSIKGIDNYLCIDNMEKHSLGTCKIRNKPAKQMHCYSSCPYFNARDFASAAPTALLNYAYWLIHMNYVNPGMDEPPFPPRKFTICDEAHKIVDIVQSHYSPRFDAKTVEKLAKLTDFFNNYKLNNLSKDFIHIKEDIDKLYKTDYNDELNAKLIAIRDNLQYRYRETWEKFKDEVKKQYPHDDPPREWKEALRLCDWVKDMHCKIDDYVRMIEVTSTDTMVKNPTGENELTFNCLDESWMMHKYFHAHTGFTLLMSATFADPSKYLKSIALDKAKYIKLDSQFDFTASPIYFYNKRRMSYKQIEGNLPWMFERIDEILDNHKMHNGIIHTASYDLALKIFSGVSAKNRKRILVYSGTEEKRQVIEMLKTNNDKIIMGPSLTTGLDLKDDWSRFAIIAKVPYPSLSDKFIAKKLEVSPDWYRWRTIIEILQSVGRTVRHENDWCKTYILDGALADLIHNNRKAFPPEFMSRLVVVD